MDDETLETISTMALAVSGGSGNVGGDDAQTIATQLDAAVDSLSTGNATADSLIKAADNSVDLLLAMMGVDDPDEDVTVGDSDDTQADHANACQAALAAAANEVTDNADLSAALDLANQLVAALSSSAPADDAAPADAPSMTAAIGDDPAAETTPVDDTATQQAFELPIMVIEGIDTGDGRFIDPGVLTWREPPIPLMGILKTTYGHDDAELVGRIDSLERIDISTMTNPKTGQPYGEGISALKGVGVFTSLENAQTMSSLISEGFIRGVSVDLGDVVSEFEMVDQDGNVVDEDEDEIPIIDLLWFATEDEAFADDTPADDAPAADDEPKQQIFFRERMTAARVMGATVCPFPAFEGAYIQLADGTASPTVASEGIAASSGIRVVDEPFERRCEPCEGGAMVASSAPLYPPKAWFEMEEPNELTPLTITDDGRFYGHAAGWQSCHTGYSNRCVLAPKSRTNYANFLSGAVKTAEGDIIPVGAITMGTGHADTDPHVTAAQAMSHYDNTGTVAALVTAKNGKFGVWVCGALEPDLDELAIRRLRSSKMSGDWRPIGRGSEMIAVLAVNAPGFLVPRVTVASGRVTSLVAAGVVPQRAENIDPATHVPADIKNFMSYMLDKDARAARAQMQAGIARAEQLAAQRATRTTDALRARIHKS